MGESKEGPTCSVSTFGSDANRPPDPLDDGVTLPVRLGRMRPITHSDLPEVFDLVEQRWRRVPELVEFPLYDGRQERTESHPLPRAHLVVWPHHDAGIRLWVVAWDTDRARLERFQCGLPKLFSAGPLVWDGIALRGGRWSTQMSDPNPGEPDDDGSTEDREPPHAYLVHLLSAESRWWVPGHEPAKGSLWWTPDDEPANE